MRSWVQGIVPDCGEMVGGEMAGGEMAGGEMMGIAGIVRRRPLFDIHLNAKRDNIEGLFYSDFRHSLYVGLTITLAYR